jgi:hypothetical protein
VLVLVEISSRGGPAPVEILDSGIEIHEAIGDRYRMGAVTGYLKRFGTGDTAHTGERQ